MTNANHVSHSLVIFQVVDSNGEFFLKSSELFESPVYLDEVADVLCILQAGTNSVYYKKTETHLSNFVSCS